MGLYNLLQLPKVLFASVSRLSEADRTSLQSNLLTLVQRFKVPPELISIAVDVITVVSSLQVPKDNMKLYQSAVDSWAVPILEDIDTNISTVLLKPSAPDCSVEEEKLSRQIFTLVELLSDLSSWYKQENVPPHAEHCLPNWCPHLLAHGI